MVPTHQILDKPSTSVTASPAVQNVPPRTPERGRGCTRYPSHLSRQLDSEGKPRPFLHRRGTSNTYETLEDLLKEAGYKETRVFTPEMERREAEREERREREAALGKRAEDAGGVGGAVVKLFSAWMPARRVDADGDAESISSPRPHPPSPLAHRSKKPASNVSSLRGPSPGLSSGSSTLTVRPANLLHPDHALHRQHSLTRQPSRPALASSSTFSTSPFHPPSRARLALRHAASAPHIDKRRVRTQPRASRANKSKAPPLPPTWLESLSAALRSPRFASPPASPNSAPRKPALVSHRAHTSPVAVTITNVVCRSAPSSRSSSAVRRSANKARVLVPTLAQTSVCEELASTVLPPHSPHHLPHDDAAMELDDDEDEELNLTMMLIPSKRQHSIRSLRSVLQHHSSLPSSNSVASASGSARIEYERMMRRRIGEAVSEGDAEPGEGQGEAGGHWDSGEFLTARVKRRRSGLPPKWGWAS